MNRIQHVADAATRAPDSERSTVGSLSSARLSRVSECGYALSAPLHYEAGYGYPLLVWLHGPGDDEGQLKRIMPLVSLRNYVGLAVRGTMPCDREGGGYHWSQRASHQVLAEQRIFDAIEVARGRYNIAANRVFLAGFDCGGTMAFRIGLEHAERFAGVLSVCGELPSGRPPLARLSCVRRLPIFLACGRDSEKYVTATVCENLKLFHSAGMHISLRQYPCRQEIAVQMLSDMDRWIMEQITGSAES